MADRWPTDEERPATCPVCGIGWDSTDLRRHPDKPLPWWRCSDCGCAWHETIRKHSTQSADAIVRELAERGPFLAFTDMEVDFCPDCDVVAMANTQEAYQAGIYLDLNDPANHKPSCLWRRARELHPQVVPQD